MTMTRFFVMTLIFEGILTPVSSSPSSAGSGLLLVANKGDQTLGLIDPDTGRQVATVAEGGTTRHEVVGSPDGNRAFVPIPGNSAAGLPPPTPTPLAATHPVHPQQ